jgi:hypothetical protein
LSKGNLSSPKRQPPQKKSKNKQNKKTNISAEKFNQKQSLQEDNFSNNVYKAEEFNHEMLKMNSKTQTSQPPRAH